MLEPAPLLDSDYHRTITGRWSFAGHSIACDIGNQGTPSERVAICKAIEDEIRQRAEARRNSRLKHSSIVPEDLPERETGESRDQVALVGTRASKGDLQEDLPEGITGQSRDHAESSTPA